MKARLRDGTTIELVKECGCLTHEGPHWLHMDAFDRQQSLKMLPPGGLNAPHISMIALHAFCANELVRLGEKRYQMERQGIEALIVDTPADQT